MDHHHEKKTINEAFKDPVCGMAVTEESKFHEQVGNKTFYFCSEKCQIKFKHDPALYIAKENGSASANASLNKMEAQSNSVNANTSSIYTCPMHPKSGKIIPVTAPYAVCPWNHYYPI